MPIIRKLVTVGDSKGVTLPKSWIEYAERKSGKKMVGVEMEVNGSLVITPVFEDVSCVQRENQDVKE